MKTKEWEVRFDNKFELIIQAGWGDKGANSNLSGEFKNFIQTEIDKAVSQARGEIIENLPKLPVLPSEEEIIKRCEKKDNTRGYLQGLKVC